MLKARVERSDDLERVDMVLMTRVCHPSVPWHLRKLPLLLPLPNSATVDPLLEILRDSQPCLMERTQL